MRDNGFMAGCYYQMILPDSFQWNTFVYAVAGLNLRLNLFHFIDLEAKYRGSLNRERYLSSCSAMANLYFTRAFGISYRLKYTETVSGCEFHHLFGMAFVFR